MPLRNELVATSFDNGAFAIRRIGECTDSPAKIRWPRAVFGADGCSVDLVLCDVANGCESSSVVVRDGDSLVLRMDAFQAFERRAIELKLLANRQAAALEQQDSEPLQISFTIPADMVKLFGIDRDVRLSARRIRKGPGCGLVAETPGFGSATVVAFPPGHLCTRDQLTGAWMTVDSGLFIYTYNDCDHHGIGYLDPRQIAARLYNAKGMAAHRRRDFESSKRNFAKAVELRQDWGQAHFNLACALARLGNTNMALDALEQAIKRDTQVFRAKAAKDADFANLRQHQRFLLLTSP